MVHRMNVITLVVLFLPGVWGAYHVIRNLIAIMTGEVPTWNPSIVLFGVVFFLVWIPLLIYTIRPTKKPE